MISGIVNSRNEAIIRLRIRGPRGTELEIDSIVDTGFTSFLTLPAVTIASLALNRQTAGTSVLADGSVREFDIFSGEVLWEGAWRPVLVSALGNESLLGMRLMLGHKLVVDVVPGGSVGVAPLS
jgi:clan AA aspartic protease